MTRSLKWRLITLFCLLIAGCVGILSIFLSNHLENSYMDNLQSRLIQEVTLFSRVVPEYITESPDSFDAGVKKLGASLDIRLTVIALDGQVLADSLQLPSEMENHSTRIEFIDALASGIGISIHPSASLGYEMLYVATLVKSGQDVLAVARVALPVEEVYAAVREVDRTILLGAVISILAAGLLAVWVAASVTRPVKELTAISRRIAQGQMDTIQIDVSGKGEMEELAKAFRLMTERLRDSIKAVSSERDYLSAVLERMGDGIFLLDREGSINLLNHASERIFKLEAGGVIGHSFVEAIRDHEINAVFERAKSSGRQEMGFVELTAGKRFLGIIATPLVSQSGYLVLVQDLSELRRLEKVRRDFVANISHELRTPITSLKLLTETLQEGAASDPDVAAGFIDKIHLEVDKLAQLVTELSDLSAIESGQAVLNLQPGDIRTAIKLAAERLSPQAERAGIILGVELPETLPQVRLDENRVEQVLVNLVHNAIKFTPKGGKIKIGVRTQSQTLVVYVTDSGIGIPEDDLTRVFERFYKVDKSRSGGGTGLGLAISKHIVQAHGGSIWAESVYGKGATFSFSLPLA
ncbi:ATPase [Dehalococcoides mccartyi]|uniref:ATP-binding protein n=1 Tax=Dehalococcoides mccartyi TaxID=61435 RepID=UPI0002B76D9B|nr:ATP-binding protein [Dehalococcoides mccartyi]AGG07206.1 phosphate regulon sensor protein PhoR (SphS) [Dehalococcoides mccartyi BTF08]KSV16505.1 ATPase [Dehalococcoides mccartyi]